MAALSFNVAASHHASACWRISPELLDVHFSKSVWYAILRSQQSHTVQYMFAEVPAVPETLHAVGKSLTETRIATSTHSLCSGESAV